MAWTNGSGESDTFNVTTPATAWTNELGGLATYEALCSEKGLGAEVVR